MNCETEEKTTLYLVRHGATDSNKSGVFQGTIDTSLNEAGFLQAKKLASKMAGLAPAAIYSSNLLRAVQTAQEVGKVCGVDVKIYKELAEINLGDMQGKTAEECIRKFPEAAAAIKQSPASFCAPNGDSARMVYDRMRGAIGEIVARNKNKTVLVVSHGYAIQMYIHFATGLPFEQLHPVIVGNTAINKFEFGADGVPKTQYINSLEHLPPELITDMFAEKKL